MSQPRWHTCNILEAKAETKRLWHFGTSGGQVRQVSDHQTAPGQSLPSDLIHKDWKTLYRGKLNIGWLPEENVFLRLVEVPAAERAEVLSMVELQLEKVSPIPVAQIAWTAELLAKTEEGLQPVVVVIAARSVVEEYLGRLEAEGFLTDRLEVPLLSQFLSTRMEADGVWIHLKQGPITTLCLTGWWFGGRLRHITLSHLPSGDSGLEALTRHLTQSAWAAELEGWLQVPFQICLVASPDYTALWSAKLGHRFGTRVKVLDAPDEAVLARQAAESSASPEPRGNLLPREHLVRYRQQFVDGLWMKSLLAVLALYVMGLILYFAAVKVLEFQVASVDKQVQGLGGAYTNALQMEAKIQVLQEQSNLRFATLDCWKAAAELLPSELTLENFALQNGRTLQLDGYAPADSQGENLVKITDYNQALKHATNEVGLIFSQVSAPSVDIRAGKAGPQTATWRFVCELNTKEGQ